MKLYIGRNAYNTRDQTLDFYGEADTWKEMSTLCIKYVDEKGAFDIEKCHLMAYANGGYYALGRKLGKFGYSVMKKKTAKRYNTRGFAKPNKSSKK